MLSVWKYICTFDEIRHVVPENVRYRYYYPSKVVAYVHAIVIWSLRGCEDDDDEICASLWLSIELSSSVMSRLRVIHAGLDVCVTQTVCRVYSSKPHRHVKDFCLEIIMC